MGTLFPSIITKLGFFFNLIIALFIANIVALKMFSFSISFTDADPKAQHELFLIYLFKISLFSLEIFFESFNFFFSILLFKITAAAYTGPIKLPLPTSSTPAIIFFITILYLLRRSLFESALDHAMNIFFDLAVLTNMLDEM